MSVFSALRKIFQKKKRFSSPKEYKLNSKEFESLAVLIAILLMMAVAGVIVLIA